MDSSIGNSCSGSINWYSPAVVFTTTCSGFGWLPILLTTLPPVFPCWSSTSSLTLKVFALIFVNFVGSVSPGLAGCSVGLFAGLFSCDCCVVDFATEYFWYFQEVIVVLIGKNQALWALQVF